MCDQRRLKSACASAKSDHILRYLHEETASSAIKNMPSEDSDQPAQADLNLRWAHMSEVPFLTLRFTVFQDKNNGSFRQWLPTGSPLVADVPTCNH